MTPVDTVAKYIVKVSDNPVSNLKLQKLLYYVQGWHLGLTGKALFPENLEAWIHGPVVPKVFFVYKKNSWNPIQRPSEEIPVGDDVAAHIQNVLNAYGKLSAAQLEALSHTEAPWLAARKDVAPTVRSQAVISHKSMEMFFSQLANG